eukprot:Sspe_Gene.18850::Locus_6815_Transcript_1_1_Confidence_1.000_Length_1688::g.18850::m.18850
MSYGLEADPRTGLPIVDIPKRFQGLSILNEQLKGRVIHYINNVTKANRRSQSQKRILVITDEHVQFRDKSSQGHLKRSFPVKAITCLIELRNDSQNRIPLQISGHNEFDCLFEAKSEQDKSDIIRILDRVREHHTGKPIPRRELKDLVKGGSRPTSETDDLLSALKLKKPHGWTATNNNVTKIVDLLERSQMQDREKERKRKTMAEEFERIKGEIRMRLAHDQEATKREVEDEIRTLIELTNEKEREIELLQEEYRSLLANPVFWENCPTCRLVKLQPPRTFQSPDQIKKAALERKLEDYRQLINHLQNTRNSDSGPSAGAWQSSQVSSLQKELDEAKGRLQQLQKLIIENPHPTEDIRIKAEQIAQGETMSADDTPRIRELHSLIAELNGALASKDRELRHTQKVMQDAFKRQVEELDRVRQQFQWYDEHIVNYLEKLFSGNAFPMGLQSHGQSPLQIAKSTSQAARQAATPPAFPNHTASVNMPESGLPPYHERTGSRRAASPIGQFVPPNILSAPSPPRGT